MSAAPDRDCCWIGDPCPEHNPTRYKGFAEQIAWEDVEIGLRGVLSAAWAFDAAMCLKNLGWAVVRDD